MPAGRSLIIVSDAFALAETALARMVKRIEDVTHEVTTSGVAICLTGGSTPKHMYRLMAQPPWRERIPWARVHWFIGDDRLVPDDNALSNSGMAERLFLSGCAPRDHVHMIDTGFSSPDESAIHYEQRAQRFWTTIPHAYRMHVQGEFLISPAASDAEVRWAGRTRAAASAGIEAAAPCRASSKGDPHEIIEDRRPGCRRLGPKVHAPTHP